jgi:tellurite resistance protein TerC
VTQFLQQEWLGKPVEAWAGFLALILFLLVLDLSVLNRKSHVISMRESLLTTLGYMVIATLFGVWIAFEFGLQPSLQYMTGYIVELSLSMDNVFVIALILGYFKVPREYQHRVLFWGIVGVIVLRGGMIGAGSFMIEKFHDILYLFGAFLIITGLKMLLSRGSEETDIGKNPILRFLRKYGRVCDDFHGERFFVRLTDSQTGRYAYYMTPLLVALILVEFTDVIFAVDSVPAIFAITTDPFIVFTSNIFAILGLRSLYFSLSALMNRFSYLQYALASLLIFIGLKMLVIDMLGIFEMSPAVSLLITFLILGSGIGYSLWKTRRVS